jgi:hypothetical protein
MSHRTLLLAGALSLFSPAWAAVTSLPPGARLVDDAAAAPDAARVAADAAPVLAAVRRGEGDAAVRLLRALDDPWRFEAAASLAIEQMQIQAPSAAAEQLLAALAREPVRLYRRHDETAGDWFVPLYDIPKRAASARTLLARIAARDALLPALRAGKAVALAGTKDPAVLAAALEALTPVEAKMLAAAALSQPAVVPPSAWSLLARKAPTPALLDMALQRAPEAEFLPLLQELPQRIEAGQALDWLDRAAARPAYLSAVAAALGRLAPRSAAAEAKLIALLGDAQAGPSAAAALARLDVPDRVGRIDAALAKASDPSVVARLALALRLEGSPAANERLRRLQGDPRLPDATRQELQR